jgi:hypothetical protein
MPWAILRGRVTLREVLITNDLGLWVVQWFLVDSPVCMTLLERRGNTQMEDDARWCAGCDGNERKRRSRANVMSAVAGRCAVMFNSGVGMCQ